MEKFQSVLLLLLVAGFATWIVDGGTPVQKGAEKKPTRNDLTDETPPTTTANIIDTTLTSIEDNDNVENITITPIGSFGVQCTTNCSKFGHHGKEYSYYFCYSEDYWDYCSPKLGFDYRGMECKDPCAIREGVTYKWCHTTDGTWGYCA